MKVFPSVFPVGVCSLLLTLNLSAQTFYVAPSGSDANDGSLATPFQTVARAKTAAVAALQGAGTNVEIQLRAGKYPLIPPASDPLAPGISITNADIPAGEMLVFRNYPGETAVLHGAVEFSGTAGGGTWSDTTLTDVYNGNISPTALKSVAVKKFTFSGPLRDDLQARIQNLKAADINGGHFVFTQLYREDSTGAVKKIRARQPNDAMNVDTSHFTYDTEDRVVALRNQVARCRFNTSKVVRTAGIPRFINDGHTEIRFTRMWQTVRAIIHDPDTTSGGDIKASLTDMENPEIGNTQVFTYDDERCLAEVNPVTSFGTNQHAVWETWNRGWMENNIHFLDDEGEWFFDETDIVLYYRPPAGEVVTTSVYSLPVTYTLFRLRGTDDTSPVGGVHFHGEISTENRLQFEKTAWKYENGRGNSKFFSFQDHAYGLTGLIDGIYVRNVSISGCAFNDVGATAIAMGGNRKHLNGKMDSDDYGHQERGIAANLTILGNTFSRCGGSAIRIDHYPILNYERVPGPEDLDHNSIAYNDIFAVGKNFSEAPAITVLHSMNTIVEYNTIMNAPYVGIEMGASNKRSSEEANKIRFNTIDHAMTTLSDGGGIYTRTGWETVVRDNHFERIGSPRAADAVAVVPFMCETYFDRNSRFFSASGNTRLATEGPLRMMYRDDGLHEIWQPGRIRPAIPGGTMNFGFNDDEDPYSAGLIPPPGP